MERNLFEQTASKVKGNKIVILLFAASLAMLLIGVNHFREDTLSSLYGVQMLETLFGLRPAIYPITYWTMSIAPQVAQVVFMYLYMTNTKKNVWALFAVIVAFGVDFLADVHYRSDNQLFENPESFMAASILTIAYFTIGSELFVTVGFGIVTELFGPAIRQLIEFISDTFKSVFPKRSSGGHPSQQSMQQRQR